MKRVIRFSRARYWFFAFSAALIIAGIVGYVANHGLNLGVDFKAGVSYQFQVAPAAFTVEYSGPDKTVISIPAGEQALTAPGDIIFTVTNAKNGSEQTFPFRYSSYATVKDLTDAISQQVTGVSVVMKGDPAAPPKDLEPLPRPADITNSPCTINLAPAPGRGVETSISEVRALMAPLGEFTLTAVGAPVNQEFIARLPVTDVANEATFQQDTQKALMGILEGKFGQGQIILKSSDFVGARMAQSLASQTIWLVIIAVALILLYMTFRFHPWIYAVAAVLGIVHDGVVMLAFDAVFRVEIDAGTIAAILTILGYSINDTIVNFDRARENTGLMRGESLRLILDTSVTQNLSRTFITSGATMLTVVALFILTSGTIKNFALNMIVGIVEGTYSTFISAFFVIEWVNWREKRRKTDTLSKYGITTSEKQQAAIAAVEAVTELAEPEDEGEEVPEGTPEGVLAADAPGAGEAPVTAVGAPAGGVSAVPAGVSGASSGAPAPGSAPQAPRPALPANPFGNTGSRKHKKHRRHHH